MNRKTAKRARAFLGAAEVFLRTVADELRAEGVSELPTVAALIDEAKAHGEGLARARELLAEDLAHEDPEPAAPVCRFGPGGDYVRDWPA